MITKKRGGVSVKWIQSITKLTMPFEIGNRFGVNNVGGARPGAGRKPNVVKRLATNALADPDRVAGYLARIEELADAAENEKVRLAALIYLVDRILGKTIPHARQSAPVQITVEGPSLLRFDDGAKRLTDHE